MRYTSRRNVYYFAKMLRGYRSVSGSKRSRISESTILSTGSDIGNEDDRDSDSGGELRTDRTLGNIITRYPKGERTHVDSSNLC